MASCAAERTGDNRDMPGRLGIMGGTFDPVHLGHLRTAEEAIEILGLDQILFVPAASPPHKPGRQILSFGHRLRMLELAITCNPRFRLSDMERRIPGKSYTVNSLRRLREESQDVELFFLVGLDAFLEMDTWFQYEELFRLASIVVLRRPGSGEGDVGEFLVRKVSESYHGVSGTGVFSHPELFPVYYLPNTQLDISSTGIRELAAAGRSIRYMVPGRVLNYIGEECLYKDQVGGPGKRTEDARSGKCGTRGE
jgi:nicotinate-nucleotide adenylyltransferase